MRALLALAALPLLLAGCSDGTRDGVESPPSPRPSPTWPASGCDEHSMASIDYASDAAGSPTREKAAEDYMEPGDALVRQGPQPPHHRRGWLVVTRDDEIRAIVTIFRTDQGFLVDSVESCSG